MNSPTPIKIPDLLSLPAHPERLQWEPFREGVMIYRLYGNQKDGPSAALLKYEPGTKLPRHSHAGYEHIFVLSNSQIDQNGEHHAGSLVINPPGTSHQVTVPKASIVLAIWEKPVVWE